MSRWDDLPTTRIVSGPNRRLGNAHQTRTHQTYNSDWRLEPDLLKSLSRLGTEQGLQIDGDPTTVTSSYADSNDNPDLTAIAAPSTLFCSSESITEFATNVPDNECKLISLQYYLQQDEGILPRFSGLDQRLTDTRGLLSSQHLCPRRPWDSDLRDILPGLLVIDCSSRQVVAADPSCPYVALSYVWGPGGGGEKYFSTDLRGRHIPRTIRDALNVVRVLGMKYLWVDRYCINSSDQETKHHTINNMDAIYEAAYLTIIAASGSDDERGLPSVSNSMRALHEGSKTSWDGIVYSEFSGPHRRQFQKTTYSARGWTFQEDLLSQRRLIFTDNRATIYYEKKGRITESSGIFAHINEYSRRTLTYPSDMLKAFLGVLRAYERLKPPVKHIWGVPFLLDSGGSVGQPGDGLLWRTNRQCSLRRISGLPSWTWAGWDSWPTHYTADGCIASRKSELGPYRWLLDKEVLRRGSTDWEPSDISLEVEVAVKLVDVFDYFRADHRRASPAESEEPAPVLYLTSWSTTVNVCISRTEVSRTEGIHSLDKDLNAKWFAVDPTLESLHNGEPPVNGRWSYQWTAAIICWGARKDDATGLRTQALLLEQVGDDRFRRVGALETDWHKSDLDKNGHIDALGRSFARRGFRIE